MARAKTKTVVFAVAPEAPTAVFMREDLAGTYAAERGLSVHSVTILTEPDLRAQKKAAALAVLTPEQKAALGLVKKPKAVTGTGEVTVQG